MSVKAKERPLLSTRHACKATHVTAHVTARPRAHRRQPGGGDVQGLVFGLLTRFHRHSASVERRLRDLLRASATPPTLPAPSLRHARLAQHTGAQRRTQRPRPPQPSMPPQRGGALPGEQQQSSAPALRAAAAAGQAHQPQPGAAAVQCLGQHHILLLLGCCCRCLPPHRRRLQAWAPASETIDEADRRKRIQITARFDDADKDK